MHHVVVDFKIFCNSWLGSQEITREPARAGFCREQHITTKEQLLELRELRCIHDDIRRNPAAAGNLAPAVGQPYLSWVLRHLALVMIFVERYGFVIALNQPSSGRVITRTGQGKPRILTKLGDILRQSFMA